MKIHTNYQSNRLTKLEALRGFAAVYVLLSHTFAKGLIIGGISVSVLLGFGQEAVILFFVLSGFVIQHAYARSKNKSFKSFFLKRFLRIYIPVSLVFITQYMILSISNGSLLSINWWTLAGNVFMLQDISFLKPNVTCEPFLGNLPLWSLSYEWWFYMLFFVAVNNIKEKTSLAVYSAGIVSAITYIIYPNFINREIMYLVIWWVGADLAKLFLHKKEITFTALKLPLISLVLIILILCINAVLHHGKSTVGLSPFLELRHFSFALLTVFLGILWRKLYWIGFRETLGVFRYVAPISFGIYISQWFLVAQAHYLDHYIKNDFFKTLLYTFVCISFSYLIERVIYIRVNKWVRNKIVIIRAKC